MYQLKSSVMKKIIAIVLCSSFVTAMMYCSTKQEERYKQDTAKLHEDVKALGEDIKESAAETTQDIKDAAHDAKENAKEKNREMKEEANEFKQDLKDDVKDIKENHSKR